MMTGIDNYRRAIEFGGPDYLPCALGVDLDWLRDQDPEKQERVRELQRHFPDDLLDGLNAARQAAEPEVRDGVTRWTDEWGTGWQDDGHGAKTESYPLLRGYAALDRYAFPDPQAPDRFAAADRALQEQSTRYTCAAVWFTLFERLWMLRGFENMLVDPYLHGREFSRLRDRIVEYNLAIIDQWLARRVHGVFFSDDWGSQRGLLMNPADWRRFYKPSYARMFNRVRSGGAHVWMHLCGDITAILPDLIDIGLNVLHPVQPQAMDVGALAQNFGGKLCFFGGVDVQGTLIHAAAGDVRREVHRLVDLFGRYRGGYIGGTSHSIMPETPLDNVIALYGAFREYRQTCPGTPADPDEPHP